MGEGEGRKDVSDQIEDEDQLLGAQQKDQPPPETKVSASTLRSGFSVIQQWPRLWFVEAQVIA